MSGVRSTSADAYRTIASPDLSVIPAQPCGLVRANGACCTCTAPGSIWCWWYDVQIGDRWYCRHGGGWKRVQEPREAPRWVLSAAHEDRRDDG